MQAVRVAILALIFTALAVGMAPGCPMQCAPRQTDKDTDSPKPASPREQAGADFNKNVQRWGWMVSVLLILAGVGIAVLSFTTFGKAMDFELREGLSLLAASAAVALIQYGLQAWGMIAMDIVVWASLAVTLATAATFGYRWIKKRRKT